jgi:hypothetical protein
VANPNWWEKFRETNMFVLAARSLDHCPLLLNIGVDEAEDICMNETFKFEAT